MALTAAEVLQREAQGDHKRNPGPVSGLRGLYDRSNALKWYAHIQATGRAPTQHEELAIRKPRETPVCLGLLHHSQKPTAHPHRRPVGESISQLSYPLGCTTMEE